MRRIIFLALLFCLTLPTFAQEDEPTPYEIALQRIQEAEASGATELDLSHLGLTELPSEIGNLSNLQYLVLLHNQLTSLPTEIGNLRNLRYLSVGENQLQSLVPEIFNLVNLQVLQVYENQLTSLPTEIENLRSLSNLDISQNIIHELPPEIGNLNNLEWLYVGTNQLRSLPIEIGNLNNLCFLSVSNNEISQLPRELSQITHLRSGFPCGISLDGNPLISPPQEVIAQGTLAILDYLENEAWWHLQRLIVGGASSFGVFAAVVLGMRWRHRGKQKNKHL